MIPDMKPIKTVASILNDADDMACIIWSMVDGLSGETPATIRNNAAGIHDRLNAVRQQLGLEENLSDW
jgi:hypothetical protein